MLGHFLFVFQAWKIYTTESAQGVSLIGFLIAFMSLSSWFVYGLIIKDAVLIINNAFGLIVALICIYEIIIWS
ncbi:SemiSWEET family transporter [Candidatus Bealeia paramacronuclearis]